MSKYSLEHFLVACGASGPLQLTVEHAVGFDRHLLHQPFAVVGRDSRADLRVTDANLARRHLYLQILCGRLLCLDLTTSSPDGRRQPLHRWLTPGAGFRLSSSTIRPTHPPGTASPPDISPNITLRFIGGATDKAELRIRHPLVLIGQAYECQVRLRDERVSRFHCALVNTKAGLWVVDLLGRGGVTLNGVLVRCAQFDEGDQLGIGGAFTIQMQPTSPAEQHLPGDTALAVAGVTLAPPPPALPTSASAGDETLSLATSEDAGRADIAEASPTSMTLAFARLQQQMAEQFHMTMTRVVGAFREIHRDQMKMVFQEFARVQQLTDELTALKVQLHDLRHQPAARPSGHVALPPSAHSEPPSPVGPTDSSGARAAKLPPPKSVRPSEQSGSSASPRVDVHQWLSGRVDAVQREREGRWQKIMGLLGGSSPSTR